jgi:hypothetical protein
VVVHLEHSPSVGDDHAYLGDHGCSRRLGRTPIVMDWRDHPQTPGRDEPTIRKAMAKIMMNFQELLFLS